MAAWVGLVVLTGSLATRTSAVAADPGILASGGTGVVASLAPALSAAPSPTDDGVGCDVPPPPPTPPATPVPGGSPSMSPVPSPMPTLPPLPPLPPLPAQPPLPTPYRPLGVDASHWNDKVAWDKVAASGVRFAYLKASQGTRIVDARYAHNLRAARKQGISVGSYHFFDYRQDGRKQANWFVSTMTRSGGLRDSLPPVVDVECFSIFGASDQAYVRTQLRAFTDRVTQLTGRPVMVYTGRWSWSEVTGDAATFGDLPLWIACWTCPSGPSMPPGWSDWAFWQTGTKRIPGAGRLDVSVAQGTDADLLTLRADGRPQAH